MTFTCTEQISKGKRYGFFHTGHFLSGALIMYIWTWRCSFSCVKSVLFGPDFWKWAFAQHTHKHERVFWACCVTCYSVMLLFLSLIAEVESTFGYAQHNLHTQNPICTQNHTVSWTPLSTNKGYVASSRASLSHVPSLPHHALVEWICIRVCMCVFVVVLHVGVAC